MKTDCLISRRKEPNVAQLYHIDLKQNLINNIRILCIKFPETFKYFVPEDLFLEIRNGAGIPIVAEILVRSKKEVFMLDPLRVILEQLDDYGLELDKAKDNLEIRIEIEGADLPTPNMALVSFSTTIPAHESNEIIVKDKKSPSLSRMGAERSKEFDIVEDVRPVSEDYNKDNTYSEKKTKKKMKLMIGVLGATSFVVMIIMLWFVSNSAVRNIEKAIAKHNYSEVVALYNEKVSGHASKESRVNEQIGTAIDAICSDYMSGQSEFDTASDNLKILETLNNSELSGKAKKAADEIEMHEKSSASYKEGLSWLEKSEYVNAITAFLDVHENSEYYNDAKNQIELCVKELVDSVNNLEDEDAYLSAIDTIDTVLQLLPNDSRLIKCRDALYSEYENLVVETTISSADELMAQESYKEALNVVDSAVKRLGQVQALLDKRNEYEKIIREKYISNIDLHVQANDYTSAFQDIKNALDILEKDVALTTKNDELKQSFVEYISLKVDNKVKEGKYDEALALITDAKELYSSSEFDILYKDVEAKQAEAIERAKNYTAKTVDFVTFSGSIQGDKETDKYTITASETGSYRFYLADMVSGFKVKIYVYESDGTRVKGDYGLAKGDGITCELSKGKTYTIEVSDYSNTGSYTLYVGQQKATVDVTSHEVIYDSMEYVDQINNYKFIPAYSGIYHFGFLNMVNGFKMKLYVYDSLGYKVNGDYGLGINEGVTAKLNAGEEYRIVVSHYSNLGEYTLSIGKQTPTVDITNQKTVNDSITFVDQNNVYTFTSSATGKYRFTLCGMENEFKVKLYVYDSLGYKVGGDYGLRSGESVSVNLENNQTYEIHLTQYSKVGNYSINIARE